MSDDCFCPSTWDREDEKWTGKKGEYGRDTFPTTLSSLIPDPFAIFHRAISSFSRLYCPLFPIAFINEFRCPERSSLTTIGLSNEYQPSLYKSGARQQSFFVDELSFMFSKCRKSKSTVKEKSWIFVDAVDIHQKDSPWKLSQCHKQQRSWWRQRIRKIRRPCRKVCFRLRRNGTSYLSFWCSDVLIIQIDIPTSLFLGKLKWKNVNNHQRERAKSWSWRGRRSTFPRVPLDATTTCASSTALHAAKGEERRSEMLIDSDRLIGCIAFEKRGVVGTRKASPIGRCRKSYLKYIHKTPASKSDGELWVYQSDRYAPHNEKLSAEYISYSFCSRPFFTCAARLLGRVKRRISRSPSPEWEREKTSCIHAYFLFFFSFSFSLF